MRPRADGGGLREGSQGRDRVVSSRRLDARRRAVRAAMMRRRRRTALAVAIALSISVGGWAFARSSFFALSRIQVTGVRALTAGEVVAASGLRLGTSVLGLDRARTAARVRAMPLVREAAVERVGPSTVRIVVVERTAALEVRAAGERYWVDEEGRRFGNRPAAGVLVPVLRVAPVPAPRPTEAARSRDRSTAAPPSSAARPQAAVGVRPAAGTSGAPVPGPNRRTVEVVLGVWNKLPASLARDVRWFEVGPGSTLSLWLGAIQVVLGTPDRISEKTAAVETVLAYADAEGKRLRRIDVRAPRHPAATMR